MPPRIVLEADLLRITQEQLPALRLSEPAHNILDRGAEATREVRETRGDTVDWLRQRINLAHNVRISLVTGPGILGIQESGASGLHSLASVRAQAGVEVITAPSITASSGGWGRIELDEDVTVLTGIDPEALVQVDDRPREVPEDPYTSAVIPLGLVVEVLSVATEDLADVDLTVNATIAEFVGYDSTPSQQQVQVWQQNKPIWIDPPAPRLRLREIHGVARVADGATLVLGSWPSHTAAESAPPTEPSAAEASKTPPLLLLITPTLLDDYGEPLRPRTAASGRPGQDRP